MSYKHHVGQLKKNWGILVMLLISVIFSAGVVWAFTEREFVEVQTFDVHVKAEEKYVDDKFKAQDKYVEDKFLAQDKLIEQKFENQKTQIEHLDEHIEQNAKTLEEIKDLVK